MLTVLHFWRPVNHEEATVFGLKWLAIMEAFLEETNHTSTEAVSDSAL